MNRPHVSATLETALYADDLDAASEFWTEIMGLERIAAVPGRHAFFRVGQGVLLIFDPAATLIPPSEDARLPVPPHGATGPGHYCMAVKGEEIESWRAWLESAGIAIEADLEWPQGGRSIYFRDPAGNSIELADPKIWA